MDETRRHMTPVRRPRARRARPLVSRPSHPYLTPHGTPYPLSTYLLVPCAFGLCQSNVHPNGEPIQRAERRERTSWGMPGRVRNELSVCLSERLIPSRIPYSTHSSPPIPPHPRTSSCRTLAPASPTTFSHAAPPVEWAHR